MRRGSVRLTGAGCGCLGARGHLRPVTNGPAVEWVIERNHTCRALSPAGPRRISGREARKPTAGLHVARSPLDQFPRGHLATGRHGSKHGPIA
uniref:Uncharacterized protein n=1 Tax=Streptomyces sp. 36R-2-1B TaxID=687847 RepID=D2JTC6_9ACTN|nr:hypothetical protein pYY8L.2c [Streptomyces sp. 36R-2-1B]